MLSATFGLVLPQISDQDLRSFKIERPISLFKSPPWDLSKVLSFLSSSFDPLQSVSLRAWTKLFLDTSLKGSWIFLSYLPEFQAKTESEGNPLPRHFQLKSLVDFVGNLEEELSLCPVRALLCYVKSIESIRPRPRTLCFFKKPSRSLSKNAISFFLREVIMESGAVLLNPGPLVRQGAHSIRCISTSAAFFLNVSVSRILEAASWKFLYVFTSFYLWDIQFSMTKEFSLGPVVLANSIV